MLTLGLSICLKAGVPSQCLFHVQSVQGHFLLFWSVASKAIARNLELLGSVAEAHEAEHPEEDADGLCRDHLDGADIDSLRVVAKPVAKVDALDIHLAELLASLAANEQGEQRVLDISMAPVLSLNGAQARNVAGTESCRGPGPKHDENEAWEPDGADLRHRACAVVSSCE